MELLIHQFLEFRMTEEILHHIQTLIDPTHLFQGEHHPSFQHSGTHGRYRLINHIQQRLAVLLHRIHQLKRTDCELIQSDIPFLLDTREGSDMTDARMQRYLQILKDRSAGNNTVMQMIYAESLQVLHLEMLQQLLFGRLVGKHPIVQFKGKELRSEIAFKVVLTRSVKQYLLRLEVP